MAMRSVIVKMITYAVDSFAMAYKNVVQQGAAAKAVPKSETTSGVAQSLSSTAIPPEVAMMMLNVEYGITKDDFVDKFKVMFENNDVDNGGSFYLQSKIYRARESIMPLFDEEGVLSKPVKE